MSAGDDWAEGNRRVLTRALARLRSLLEARTGLSAPSSAPPSASGAPSEAANREASTHEASTENGEGFAGSTLEALQALFDLSPLELDILLLAAAPELDGSFPELIAEVRGEASRTAPTFGLALAVLPGARWEPLAPTAPLRWWKLVEVGPGDSLVASPLRIDERILHFLVGVETRDGRLESMIEPLSGAQAGDDDELVPSHRELARRLAAIWDRTAGTADFPVVQLVGQDPASRRSIARAACEDLGLELSAAALERLPEAADDLAHLARLWEREAVLGRSALLVEADTLPTPEAPRAGVLGELVERVRSPLILSLGERLRPRRRPLLALEVDKPTSAEQRAVWRRVLGGGADDGVDDALDGAVERLVSQFHLTVPTIHAVHAGALGALETSAPGGDGKGEAHEEGNGAAPPGTDRPADPERFATVLWDTCRLQARPRLEDLAQRIDAGAGWDDLVLPAAARRRLAEIADQVRHRARVYDTWGLAAGSSRGLGVSALFWGVSGTGKTLAAEVLAGELSLDLYRIDLSTVVSKYIGETEKNLGRVFDAAEEAGAILQFDEADALFGKRSEVRDSHDRHANIEVSYLLQRMEAYRGLAILTTNLKDALDAAFLRRLRFVVEFPFPDREARRRIWSRAFPDATPTDRLDVDRLARLSVAGGAIRNIAVNAAFLAAADDGPVSMGHMLAAAQRELEKMGKPLPEAEVRDWT